MSNAVRKERVDKIRAEGAEAARTGWKPSANPHQSVMDRKQWLRGYREALAEMEATWKENLHV